MAVILLRLVFPILFFRFSLAIYNSSYRPILYKHFLIENEHVELHFGQFFGINRKYGEFSCLTSQHADKQRHIEMRGKRQKGFYKPNSFQRFTHTMKFYLVQKLMGQLKYVSSIESLAVLIQYLESNFHCSLHRL